MGHRDATTTMIYTQSRKSTCFGDFSRIEGNVPDAILRALSTYWNVEFGLLFVRRTAATRERREGETNERERCPNA